jgi:uncharacterized protein YecE (DUF72 family)
LDHVEKRRRTAAYRARRTRIIGDFVEPHSRRGKIALSRCRQSEELAVEVTIRVIGTGIDRIARFELLRILAVNAQIRGAQPRNVPIGSVDRGVIREYVIRFGGGGGILCRERVGRGKLRQRRIAVWPLLTQRLERRCSFGRFAGGQQLQGGLVARPGRLPCLEAIMLVDAPCGRRGNDDDRRSDDPVLIFLPKPDELIAADVLVNLAEKVGHLVLVGGILRFWACELARTGGKCELSGRPAGSRRPNIGFPDKHMKSQQHRKEHHGAGPAQRIRIGVGGWTYAPWRGLFYPEDLPQKRELEYMSRKLTSIEINGTYYGSQKPESFAKWHAETPDDFVFAVKGPRYATNRRALSEASASIERFFASGVLALKDKLGPINWQFPPTKKFEPKDFESFLALLPKEIAGRRIRHAVEVRHATFQSADFVALAREHGVAIAIAGDSHYPQIADLTADFVYARIMGASESQDLGYSKLALDAWAERASFWAAGSAPGDLESLTRNPTVTSGRDVFLYVISGCKARNPAAATALIERLQK